MYTTTMSGVLENRSSAYTGNKESLDSEDLSAEVVPVESLVDLEADKADPSYKSKRYRDKLRGEIRKLDSLLPVDRSLVHRKLDSQTIFRLAIAYFRTKRTLKVAGLGKSDQCGTRYDDSPGGRYLGRNDSGMHDGHTGRYVRRNETTSGATQCRTQCLQPTVSDFIDGHRLLQAVDGFLVIVAADGTVQYVSENIVQSLGFSQVELLQRCLYGVVHPDDHRELSTVLGQGPDQWRGLLHNQRPCCGNDDANSLPCKSVSFLIRMKCFNGATTGYLKMHCTGHMRSLPNTNDVKCIDRERGRPGHVLFALCRPFVFISQEPSGNSRNSGFWSKHGLDLKFKQMDKNISEILGYDLDDLEGHSFYQWVHPEDLSVFSSCHRTLIESEEIQTMYFRVQCRQGHWLWLHTRGKVVFKNTKKYSIVFTHCPVREEDSTYIQEEMALRHQTALHDLARANLTPVHIRSAFSGTGGSHLLDDGGRPIAKRFRCDPDNGICYPAVSSGQSAVPAGPSCNHVGPASMGLESSASHFLPTRRQYLMQLNGVGVSPQNVPTAVVFQGQFTAIETPLPVLPREFFPTYSNENSYAGLPSHTGEPLDQNCLQDIFYDKIVHGNVPVDDKPALACKPEPSCPFVRQHSPNCFSRSQSCRGEAHGGVELSVPCILGTTRCLSLHEILQNPESEYMTLESMVIPHEAPPDEAKSSIGLPAIGSFLDNLHNVCSH